MVSTYPTLAGRPVVIALMYEHPLPSALLEYWRRRGEATVRDGITLTTRPLADTVWQA
jgi:hypothetical protein